MPILPGLLAFVAYLTTICPTVGPGDSGELVTVAHVFGVAHPPGYPLFTVLGALFDRVLSVGEPAFRVNLVSAVFGAVSTSLAYALILRLGGSKASGFLGSLLLAFSPLFWVYSGVAEVFTLNTALCLALVLHSVGMVRREAGSDPRWRGHLVFGLLAGLALANHHTSILVIGPAGLVVLGREVLSGPRKGLPGQAVALLSGLVLGLAPYAVLPLAAAADPPLNWDDPRTLERFLRLFLRRDYGTFQLVSSEIASGDSGFLDHSKLFLGGLLRHTLFVGPPLAVVAVVGIFRRRVPAREGRTIVVLSSLTTSFVFLTRVNSPLDTPLFVGVVERFHILPQALFCILAGLGFDDLVARLSVTRKRWVSLGGATLVALLSFVVHRDEADHSSNRVVHDFGANLLHGLPEGALLFSHSDLATNALRYQIHVLGRRPDTIVLDQELLTYPWYVEAARRRHPDLVLEGERYDGARVRNVDLVRENLPRRPIFFYGFKEASYQTAYRDERFGLLRRMVPREAPPDPARLLEENLALLSGFLTRGVGPGWSEKSFEREAMERYSGLLFDLGWQAQELGQPDRAEELYLRALQIAPVDWRIHRNLGVLLRDLPSRQGDAARHLEISLELHPDELDRPAVEATIRQLRRSSGD
jgi:hypothetical protein